MLATKSMDTSRDMPDTEEAINVAVCTFIVLVGGEWRLNKWGGWEWALIYI